MVQAPSSLLWQRSRKPDNGNHDGPSESSSHDQHRIERQAGRVKTDPAVQPRLFSNGNGGASSSCPKPSLDGNNLNGLSFPSSPLSQRPLSPSATSDDGGGSDSSASTSTATAIDIPTKRSSHVPINYPGPSLGMSYMSSRASQRSSLAAFAETIHESSSDEEEASHNHHHQHRQRDRASPFDTLGAGSPLVSSPFAAPSPRYPSGLGISDTRRYNRRSLPPSTSTSPMQTLTPQGFSSSFSPSSAMHSYRRRSSGNHSPFSPGGLGNILSTSPASPSPSLFSSSFVGSYEQSLLSGRMANKPSNASTPLPFTASIGVLGFGKNTPRSLKCPDHVNIPFGAYFWDMDSSDKKGKGSPYVGTLDLTDHYMAMLEQRLSAAEAEFAPETQTFAQEEKGSPLPRFPGYRIPPKGQLQVVIKNANQTAVKLFLVPYDLSDMPPGTKTFIRQKSYDIDPNAASGAGSTSPDLPSNATNRARETLRYAIHLQFCAAPAREKERGRKKPNHAGSPVSTARRAPGLHHGHHQHQPYHNHHRHDSTSHHFEPSTQQEEIRRVSPRRRHDEESPVRPASPHKEARPRRARSDTSTASHIYLYKTIRVAFTSRALDLSEKLKTVHEGPSGLQTAPSSKDPPLVSSDGPIDKDRYSAYTGPGEEWEQARKHRAEVDRAHEKPLEQLRNLQIRQLERGLPFDPNGETMAAAIHLPQAEQIGSRDYPPPTASANGYALLNTPPVGDSFQESSVHLRGRSSPHMGASLMDAADVPEPLIFQRSPVGKNVSLPSLLESGLSISRPGSRSRNHTTSPEKGSFGSIPLKDALR